MLSKCPPEYAQSLGFQGSLAVVYIFKTLYHLTVHPSGIAFSVSPINDLIIPQ